MFNFGFGDVIDRLEKYFGKAVTGVFLATFGIAVLLFIVGFAIKETFVPLGFWIGQIVSGNPAEATIKDTSYWIIFSIWLALVLAFVVSALQAKKAAAEASDFLEEARETQRLGQALMEGIEQDKANMDKAFEAAQVLMKEQYERTRVNLETIERDARAEVASQLKTDLAAVKRRARPKVARSRSPRPKA